MKHSRPVLPQMSLKWLEVFRITAQTGSVQATAERTGLSISTVSNHLSRLDSYLGVDLLDHNRRPMVLTARGAIFLRYVEDALGLLEQALATVTTDEPFNLHQLRFAIIDDFDSDIGPELARILAASLPNCQFTHYTRVSHEILNLLRDRDLDIGIATQTTLALPNVMEFPLLRDPFVLALPESSTTSPDDFLQGKSGLPLLRYNRNQIIGALVEAQLNRLRLKLDNYFELDSTASIMALIAQGSGWAITTPSCYARAKRFQQQVKLVPFPAQEFARRISIFVAEPQALSVAKFISATMRNLLATRAIDPTTERHPWLKDRYRLLADELDNQQNDDGSLNKEA